MTMVMWLLCAAVQLIPPDFANEILPQRNQEIVFQIPREKKEWKVNYCIGENCSPCRWQVEEFCLWQCPERGRCLCVRVVEGQEKICNGSPYLSGCEEFEIISVNLVCITLLVNWKKREYIEGFYPMISLSDSLCM